MRQGRHKRNLAKADVEQRWAAFDRLTGTYLSWHKVGRGKRALRTRSGDVWANAESEHIIINGEAYQERSVGASRPLDDWSGVIDNTVWVVDEAGNPVLRFEGRHYDRRAYTRVILRDQTRFSFPVIGRRNKAQMSAVDESGNTLVHYRMSGLWAPGVECVVTPAAHHIPEIPLFVAVTQSLLFAYFDGPKGSGA